MKDLKHKLKHFFLLNESPGKIAGGFALGVFLGITPGEGIIATLLLASLFRFNRLASVVGVLLTNMWGTVAILPIASSVGGYLFNQNETNLAREFLNNYHSFGWKYFLSKQIFFETAWPLLAGFLISAGLVSLLSFVMIYALFFLKNNKKIIEKSSVDKEIRKAL